MLKINKRGSKELVNVPKHESKEQLYPLLQQ